MRRVVVAMIAVSCALGATACEAQTAIPASQQTRPITQTAVKLPLYARAQMKLKDMGQYTGAVTGKRDDATVAAIKKFQISKRLPVSGRLTPETMRALGV